MLNHLPRQFIWRKGLRQFLCRRTLASWSFQQRSPMALRVGERLRRSLKGVDRWVMRKREKAAIILPR